MGDLNPDIIGGFHRFHPWIFQAQIQSRGGRLIDETETELLFPGDEGQATFDLYRAFGEAGQGELPMTREQGRQAFASGTIGIFTDSSSILRRYEEQVGDSFEIGIAPFPRVDGGTIPAAGVAAVMLAQDDERQQAAWRFMRFVASPEGQVIVAEETAYVPANAVAFAEGTPLADYYAERPLMSAALATVPHASAWYAYPGENSVRIEEVIRDAIQSVATLQIAPQDALTQLAEDVNAILPE